MRTTTLVTIVRTAIATLALVAFIVTAGSAGATKQRRATDGNAAGSAAICEAFGGSASVSVDGFQLDIDGQAGPSRTSTTTCDGGLLDGMTCDNYDNGSSSCSASRMLCQQSTRVEPVAGLEPIEAQTEPGGAGTPEIAATSVVGNGTVDTGSVATGASSEAGSTEAPSTDAAHEVDPATGSGHGESTGATTEPVVSEPAIHGQTTVGVADASDASVDEVIEPIVVQTGDVASAGGAVLVEATEDELP